MVPARGVAHAAGAPPRRLRVALPRSDPRQAKLGFTFAREHQGRGLASEAVRTLLGYAFETLALHRVFAVVDERNGPAQRLLVRVGFREEGRFRENAWFEDAWSSERLYALLCSEWGPSGGDRPPATQDGRSARARLAS